MLDPITLGSDSQSVVSSTAIGDDFLPLITFGASSSSLLSPGIGSCLGLFFGREADGAAPVGGSAGGGGMYAGIPLCSSLRRK